jgi:hypothetical protein
MNNGYNYIPKSIDICGYKFDIIIDAKSREGKLDFDKRTIGVGTDYEHTADILDILIHEISEAIHICLGTRFSDDANNSYIFVFTHRDFQNHNEILTNILYTNKLLWTK